MPIAGHQQVEALAATQPLGSENHQRALVAPADSAASSCPTASALRRGI
jgi:hypothetical protein